MVELFLEGGPFMWPILLLLLAGLGLVGERFYSLNQSQVDSDGFMDSLRGALKSGGSKKAMNVCAGHDGPVSNICKAGLSKVGKGPEQVEKAIENAWSVSEVRPYEEKIWHLNERIKALADERREN